MDFVMHRTVRLATKILALALVLVVAAAVSGDPGPIAYKAMGKLSKVRIRNHNDRASSRREGRSSRKLEQLRQQRLDREMDDLDKRMAPKTSITKESFNQFDVDNNGLLDASEIRYLTQLTDNVDALRLKLDSDQDGYVTPEEAVAASPFNSFCKTVWYGGRQEPHTKRVIETLSDPNSNKAWFNANAVDAATGVGEADYIIDLRETKYGDGSDPPAHILDRIFGLYQASRYPGLRALLLYIIEAKLVPLPPDRGMVIHAIHSMYLDYELVTSLIRNTDDLSSPSLSAEDEREHIGFSVINFVTQNFKRDFAVNFIEVKAYSVLGSSSHPGCVDKKALRKPADGRTSSCNFDVLYGGDPMMDSFGDQSATAAMENDRVSGAFKFFASMQQLRQAQKVDSEQTTGKYDGPQLGGSSGNLYSIMYKSLVSKSSSFRAAEERWNAQMAGVMTHGPGNYTLPAYDDRTVPQDLVERIDDEYATALFEGIMSSEFPGILSEVGHSIPPNGWNLLHHCALQNRPLLVNTIAERFEEVFQALDHHPRHTFTSRDIGVVDALPFALKRKDMLLGRTPAHAAARTYGGDSAIYRALCKLEDFAVKWNHLATPREKLTQAPRFVVRDTFGRTAVEYASCTTLEHACPGPLPWPNITVDPAAVSRGESRNGQRWDVDTPRIVVESERAMSDDRPMEVKSFGDIAEVNLDGQEGISKRQALELQDMADARRLEGDWFSSGQRPDLLLCSAPPQTANESCRFWHPISGHVRTDVKEFAGLPSPEQFASFLDEGRPVVFRGAAAAMFTSSEYKQFSRAEFLKVFGDGMAPVGNLPYLNSFEDNGGVMETTMSEFVASFSNDTSIRTPLYLLSSDFPRLHPEFKDMSKPLERFLHSVNEVSGGLVQVPYPIDPSIHCGGPGSGAPVHFHNFAINVQLYGTKRWILYPRTKGFRSKVPAIKWLKESIPSLQQSPFGDIGTPLELVTQSGDILIVPKGWSHGTLMIEAGIAIVLEVDYEPLNSNELGGFGT